MGIFFLIMGGMVLWSLYWLISDSKKLVQNYLLELNNASTEVE